MVLGEATNELSTFASLNGCLLRRDVMALSVYPLLESSKRLEEGKNSKKFTSKDDRGHINWLKPLMTTKLTSCFTMYLRATK